MTALDKLETAASAITGLVVLGFLTTFDSKAKGTDEYRKAVKLFVRTLIMIPVHIAWIGVRIVVGTGAFLLRPVNQKISGYSSWRMYKGAHRAVAY